MDLGKLWVVLDFTPVDGEWVSRCCAYTNFPKRNANCCETALVRVSVQRAMFPVLFFTGREWVGETGFKGLEDVGREDRTSYWENLLSDLSSVFPSVQVRGSMTAK